MGKSNKHKKFTAQCRCYLLVENFLKDFCLTQWLKFLLEINLFHQITQVLNRVIFQLLPGVTHDIYESFDMGLEVRSVFLNI